MRYATGQYAAALSKALTDAPAAQRPAMIRRFLALLRKNRDTRRLSAIMRRVEKQSLADQGLHKVAVTSASPPTPELKKDIAAALQKKPLWEEIVDPAMLGGVRILIDDELLIDASARRRLDQMFNSTAL